MMMLDLKTVSFGRRGSTMAISWRPRTNSLPEGLYLRAVHGLPKWGEVFRISLHDDLELPFEIQATPTVLRLVTKAGHAEFIFADPSLIRFRTQGVSLRLDMKTERFDNAQPLDGETWMVSSYSASTKLLLCAKLGALQVAAPWEQLECRNVVADFLSGDLGIAEGEILEIADHVPARMTADSFETGLADVRKDWDTWRSKSCDRQTRHAKAMDLAAYVNWSALVAPQGFFKRPTMLMSKNIMCNVWSWDNCFNAMAHCESHPELAWDQFMVFFDHQTPSGAIPDCMGDLVAVWDFTKPPVYGWALSWMLRRGMHLSTGQIEEACLVLSKLTNWWLNFRDFDGDGRPEYYHGNDSGWDNGTVFKSGGPIESPDLVSFLILQMETLADLNVRLKREKEAQSWRKHSEDMMEKLIRDYWRNDRFIAYGPDNLEITDSQSLFMYLPLVLGSRLPVEIRQALVENLTDSGLITEHGLATESTKSALYEADGYWRGPIWAPSTLLIVDGLWNMGEHELARSISGKFCQLCAQFGFAENFDALSGAGLRDRSYTWTASVFLILAKHYQDIHSQLLVDSAQG